MKNKTNRANHDFGKKELRDWKLYAGDYNISKKDPYQKVYHIRRIAMHPGYDYNNLENDLALILTREPIE